MLVCEDLQLLLTLQKGHVVQFHVVQIQFLPILNPFARSAVAHPNAGNLGQFSEDHIPILFHTT